VQGAVGGETLHQQGGRGDEIHAPGDGHDRLRRGDGVLGVAPQAKDGDNPRTLFGAGYTLPEGRHRPGDLEAGRGGQAALPGTVEHAPAHPVSAKFTPAIDTSIRTSPAPGAGVSTSSRRSTPGPPGSCISMAFIVS
jgi:hypothetical protein